MTKKIYVLDTSVYLTNANSLYEFGKSDILVPLKVLEEIDKHKKRKDEAGKNARLFIDILDKLREKGSLKRGVRIVKGQGKLKVVGATGLGFLPPDLDVRNPDHIIIASALAENKKNGNEAVLVTCDIQMRVIANSLDLEVQDYVFDIPDDEEKDYEETDE